MSFNVECITSNNYLIALLVIFGIKSSCSYYYWKISLVFNMNSISKIFLLFIFIGITYTVTAEWNWQDIATNHDSNSNNRVWHFEVDIINLEFLFFYFV